MEFLDNTIKDENDIEKELGLTVIGAIPIFKGEGYNDDYNKKKSKRRKKNKKVSGRKIPPSN